MCKKWLDIYPIICWLQYAIDSVYYRICYWIYYWMLHRKQIYQSIKNPIPVQILWMQIHSTWPPNWITPTSSGLMKLVQSFFITENNFWCITVHKQPITELSNELFAHLDYPLLKMAIYSNLFDESWRISSQVDYFFIQRKTKLNRKHN